MPDHLLPRPNVLVTGVGRRHSIASAIALGLAEDGWNLALNYHAAYDDRLGYEHGPDDPALVADDCRRLGATVDSSRPTSLIPPFRGGWSTPPRPRSAPSKAWSCHTASPSTRPSSTARWRPGTGTSRSTPGRCGC